MATFDNQLLATLKKQGIEYDETHIKSLKQTFTDSQLIFMIENDISLVDMDRWKHLETMLKCRLTFAMAMKITAVFYEKDIEVIEIGHDDRYLHIKYCDVEWKESL